MEKVKLSELIDTIRKFDLKNDGKELAKAGAWAGYGALPIVAMRLFFMKVYGADMFPISWPETFWLLGPGMIGAAGACCTIEELIQNIKSRCR
jgi:hypothetical protein